MMPASKKAKIHYEQARFIRGRLPSSYTKDGFCRLCSDPRVKYYAVFRSGETWVVLAQAKDKISLNKWDTLFHPALERVELEMDMRKALEDARTHCPEFQEQGFFTFCRAKPVPSAVEPPPPASVNTMERANSVVVPAFLQANDAARKAYLDASRRMKVKERAMPPPMKEDYEVDIDVFPMARGKTSIQDIEAMFQRGRVLARQSALNQIEILRRSNKLTENMIPPCLRDQARLSAMPCSSTQPE